MNIVPDWVMSLVTAYLTPLLVWFSDRVYADLLKRDPDHLLVRVRQHLNFAPLDIACAAFHHASGPGATPTHPVARLVRALLVGYVYDWSLRELEWQLRFNLVVKWFVGYPVFAPGPDHTTLDRFELWVCEHQHRTFFDTVLRQIDADFPEERSQSQIGDTFALRANAARESLVRLIRHTCQCLLRAFLRIAPEGEADITAHLQTPALFGAPDEPGEHRLDAAGRAARLQATVLAARRCADWVRTQLDATARLTPDARRSVTVWLDRLEKLWADEVTLMPDAAGQVTQVAEAQEKGAYRLGSATDPDATYRVHGEGGKKTDFGFNTQVAATRNFVREIQADTGAQPDAASIPEVLQAQQTHHDLCPPKLIYDAAAGTGKTHAQVAEATQAQTQLVAPLLPYQKRTERLTPDQFTLAADGQTLTCPHGQTTTVAYRHPTGDGRTFRFLAHQCADCPLWTRCRSQEPGSRALRQVFISDYRPEVEAARAYAQTDAFRADMQLRPIVERIIAALVRYNGAREARRRGQRQADFQMKMCATAYNLKKWLRLLAHRAAATLSPTLPRVQSAC